MKRTHQKNIKRSKLTSRRKQGGKVCIMRSPSSGAASHPHAPADADIFVVGGGAAGLFFGAAYGQLKKRKAIADSNFVIAEKNSHLGTKVLMSGSGQCNLTRSGSIKDFPSHYGTKEKASAVRPCLYKHNNLELCRFMEDLGVPLSAREDEKIFPSSLKSSDVVSALLHSCEDGSVYILPDSGVEKIVALGEDKGFEVYVASSAAGRRRAHASLCSRASTLPQEPKLASEGNELVKYICRKLVVATGGCSYPITGSDGSMLEILSRNLDINIVEPRPSLTAVFVEGYDGSSGSGSCLDGNGSEKGHDISGRRNECNALNLPDFSKLSGVSLQNVSMAILHGSNLSNPQGHFVGDLLFTHKNLSGTVIINNSRWISAGDRLEFNFIWPESFEACLERLRKARTDSKGSKHSVSAYFSEVYGLPKRFVQAVTSSHSGGSGRLCELKREQIGALCRAFTQALFTVSGNGGFKAAMATAGGVSLDEVDMKTFESKKHKGLYFIGEVLDVDGDTGGYNLQFAYSSALCALDAVLCKE